MNAENTVPAIRFKGFSGDWISTELGKLLDITSAARVHKDEWVDDGVPFFRTSDVVSIYKGLENKKAYISFDLYNELLAKSGSVKKDDLLITGGGSIGIPYLISTNEPLYFKDADLLWLKNSKGTNGYFLFTFFSSLPFRKYLNSITHIGTISHYTIEQAKATPIKISKGEEQTKIGNYFQQLDILIAQHQQKHDKLLNLKKALLEKMFPKQGSKVPEVRFKGVSGVWEEKALGEIAEFNPKTDLPEIFEYVDLESVSGTEMISHRTESKSFAPSRAQRLARQGDVFYQTVRPYQKNNCIFDEADNDYVFSTGYAQMRPYGDSYFLLSLVQNSEFVRSVLEQCTGTSYPAINSTDLANIQRHFPSKKEQSKIGNLFKQLDTLLNQHQAQLKKLNNIKQACLEKMFV